MTLSPQEARRKAREARNKLRSDALEIRSALSPKVLTGRAKASIRGGTDRALAASQRTLRANKASIAGVAAGIGLLFIAKPLIKAFKRRNTETQNGQ